MTRPPKKMSVLPVTIRSVLKPSSAGGTSSDTKICMQVSKVFHALLKSADSPSPETTNYMIMSAQDTTARLSSPARDGTVQRFSRGIYYRCMLKGTIICTRPVNVHSLDVASGFGHQTWTIFNSISWIAMTRRVEGALLRFFLTEDTTTHLPVSYALSASIQSSSPPTKILKNTSWTITSVLTLIWTRGLQVDGYLALYSSR